MIIAILIGREGSSGFPGKNMVPVLGRPLVTYPLMAAAAAKSVGRIYFSTDSARMKEIGRQHGASIIDRPAHLCTNQALGEHAFEHAHHVITKDLDSEGRKPEIYVLLMANSPTVSAQMIDTGVRVLQENPAIDSAVSVSRYNMWSPLRARRENDDGLLDPFVPFETFGDPKTLNCDRDSQGDVWFADMGVSVIRPRNLDELEEGLLPQKWMGQKIYPLKQDAGLDIDYAWQLPQAEHWLRQNGVRPPDEE